MANWFQLLICEGLLFCFVLYHYKRNILRFWSDKTRHLKTLVKLTRKAVYKYSPFKTVKNAHHNFQESQNIPFNYIQ